tara:strand:- start:1126 stop:1725 length:600 start_codon:yes stop_codon:yes gene_type:complete
MINFIDLSKDLPHQKFKEFYDLAKKRGQNIIEAISISSFSTKKNEVNARYVNLKYIKDDEWIFFSSYESPKSIEFKEHDQICATFFWDVTNTQIRIKGKIKKTSQEFSDYHYLNRNIKKNVLAHSSNQSQVISSYEDVVKKYNRMKANKKILKFRPKNWGGFSFIPYYFEFWEGDEHRLNKRECFYLDNKKWKNYFLEP